MQGTPVGAWTGRLVGTSLGLWKVSICSSTSRPGPSGQVIGRGAGQRRPIGCLLTWLWSVTKGDQHWVPHCTLAGTRTAQSVSPSLSCCDPGAPARRPPASGVQGRGALHALARAQLPQQGSGQPSRPGPGSERPPAQPITADITREQLRGLEEDAACSQCFFLQRWLGHLGEDNEQEADAREKGSRVTVALAWS